MVFLEHRNLPLEMLRFCSVRQRRVPCLGDLLSHSLPHPLQLLRRRFRSLCGVPGRSAQVLRLGSPPLYLLVRLGGGFRPSRERSHLVLEAFHLLLVLLPLPLQLLPEPLDFIRNAFLVCDSFVSFLSALLQGRSQLGNNLLQLVRHAISVRAAVLTGFKLLPETFYFCLGCRGFLRQYPQLLLEGANRLSGGRVVLGQLAPLLRHLMESFLQLRVFFCKKLALSLEPALLGTGRLELRLQGILLLRHALQHLLQPGQLVDVPSFLLLEPSEFRRHGGRPSFLRITVLLKNAQLLPKLVQLLLRGRRVALVRFIRPVQAEMPLAKLSQLLHRALQLFILLSQPFFQLLVLEGDKLRRLRLPAELFELCVLLPDCCFPRSCALCQAGLGLVQRLG
mmetsp:Transcript_17822/g.67656  ORF Transcript_17822/g.67656 Transcript_17822/m.67656 type:complete len:394 (-) Transcript_17822:187-1368(-)